MTDPWAVLATLGFVAFGLSLIPLDQWLENRRDRRDARRRNQARRIR